MWKGKKLNSTQVLTHTLLILAILLLTTSIAGVFRFAEIKLPNEIKNQEYAKEITVKEAAITRASETEIEEVKDLAIQVKSTRGNKTLEPNGIVYEGEYIKHNIKVTNNTEVAMENIQIVSSIPEGVKYAELNYNFNEIRQPYYYEFDEDLEEKVIEIETLEAGETKEVFYEVKVSDLEEGETTKSITTTINTYIGDVLKDSYEITNEIQPAEVQLFLGSFTEYQGRHYGLNVVSDVKEKVRATVYLPKCFNLITIRERDIGEVGADGILSDGENEKRVYNNHYTDGEQLNEINVQVEDGIITAEFNANKTYMFLGTIEAGEIVRESEISMEILKAYAEAEDTKYTSNENRMEYVTQQVEVTLSSPSEGQKLKYEQELEYDIIIKNIGSIRSEYEDALNYVRVNVIDFLPEEIEPISMIYDNWKIELEESEDSEGNRIVKEREMIKEEGVIADISGKSLDLDDNKLPDVNVELLIPKDEIIIIKVKARAGFAYEETLTENNVKVTGPEIEEVISNKVAITILPYDYVEPENPNSPDEPTTPDNPDEPTTPDNPDEPINPNTPDNPTAPEEPKVPSNPDGPNNSEEVPPQINANKTCDLKIDKYISKVIVSTVSGTKEYNYTNEKLAKAEIKAQEINGATVVIEYKIVVTNVGEVATALDGIIDYLPEGLTFSSELNKNWAKNTNGKLFYANNSDYIMQAGETLKLTLIATKQMSSNTAGTFTNKAELGNVIVTGNKQDENTNNNVSEAQVIIAVSTGAYTYIFTAGIVLVVLIIIAIILYRKGLINIKKIKNAMFLWTFITVILFTQIVQAGSIQGAWHHISYELRTPYGIDGYDVYDYWYGGPTGK